VCEGGGKGGRGGKGDQRGREKGRKRGGEEIKTFRFVRTKSDGDAPSRIPPTGEIFFHSIPVLVLEYSLDEIFSIP
jgi:hypothetical protein